MKRHRTPWIAATLAVVAIGLAAPGPARAWNLALRTQIVRDAILLSPAAVKQVFAQSADSIPATLVSIPTLTKDGKRDSDEHFETALRIAADKGRDPRRLVRELIALSSYPADAIKPRAGQVFFTEIAQSKSVLVVEFDGYQRIESLSPVLARTREWARPFRETVERYLAGGEDGLHDQASEALAVLYNVAVNEAVDLWVTVLARSGYDVSGEVLAGSVIAPKADPVFRSRFLLGRRVDFAGRMSGFLASVYGASEVAAADVIAIDEGGVVAVGPSSKPPAKLAPAPPSPAPPAPAVPVAAPPAAPPAAKADEVVDPAKAEFPSEAALREERERAAREAAESARIAADAEAKRIADAEAKRKAEAEARRLAAEAETKRKADEDARRKAQAEADAKRRAADEAARRRADEEKNLVVLGGEEVSGQQVAATKVDASKLPAAQVEISRESGLAPELADVFATLDLDLGSAAKVEQAHASGDGARQAQIESRIDDAKIAGDQTVELGRFDKQQVDVSMVFVVPQSESGETGSLDAKEIGRVLAANLGGIKYCYERQLRDSPDLAGKLVVEFTIDQAGKVENPRVLSSTLDDDRVVRCLLTKVSWLKFPPPRGGKVTVSYPFVFEKTMSF